MAYDVLDLKISNLIDQYEREAGETLRNFDIDSNVSSCLSSLIAENVKVLNYIRATVSEYLETK